MVTACPPDMTVRFPVPEARLTVCTLDMGRSLLRICVTTSGVMSVVRLTAIAVSEPVASITVSSTISNPEPSGGSMEDQRGPHRQITSVPVEWVRAAPAANQQDKRILPPTAMVLPCARLRLLTPSTRSGHNLPFQASSMMAPRTLKRAAAGEGPTPVQCYVGTSGGRVNVDSFNDKRSGRGLRS